MYFVIIILYFELNILDKILLCNIIYYCNALAAIMFPWTDNAHNITYHVTNMIFILLIYFVGDAPRQYNKVCKRCGCINEKYSVPRHDFAKMSVIFLAML